jgi:endoglucanase
LVEGGSEKIVPIEKMAVDVGLSEEKAKELVHLGDHIIINGEPRALIGSRVTAAALDDRAGVAALIRCVELLKNTELNCGLTILLSGREETGEQGAKTGAYTVDPTEAIMVDVSFADQPQVPEYKCGRLSKGPMIGIAPSLNTAMTHKLIAIAKEQDIPCQFEVMGGETGTNADQVGTTREGVRTALLSIPLRYMHTPVEVIDLADVEHTAKLLAEYIRGVK